MKPTEIILELEKPVKDRRPIKNNVQAKASIDDLIEAFRISEKPITRLMLCEILGNRHDRAAVGLLLHALQEDSPGLRAEAAGSLAKIGDPVAGEGLFKQLLLEDDKSVQQMLILAIGAVGYSQAIPHLVEFLLDSMPAIRGCTAWSLGQLGAKEAEKKLEKILETEENEYAKARITEALVILHKK